MMGQSMEVGAVLDALHALDRVRKLAGFRELNVSFVDHEDPEDAEFDGWTLSGRDMLGRFHHASEAQGLIGVSL